MITVHEIRYELLSRWPWLVSASTGLRLERRFALPPRLLPCPVSSFEPELQRPSSSKGSAILFTERCESPTALENPVDGTVCHVTALLQLFADGTHHNSSEKGTNCEAGHLWVRIPLEV